MRAVTPLRRQAFADYLCRRGAHTEESSRCALISTELESVVRAIVAMSPGGLVTQTMLPPGLAPDSLLLPQAPASETAPAGEELTKVMPQWKMEREAIGAAMRLCGGNVARAAAPRSRPSTLYRKIQSWTDDKLAS